ncbi:hypothetical protein METBISCDRAFT_25053 [Metschnikowia bicuspidata]|uniref:Uncharacterized protein n=1 Tax=Metschnikowia bicuspidata TaxID=27322 RepID=A0A4P9Z754_9ASCO|nr:hypothetical protein METBISCDRAFT_25053 [Metschnikowia bicuspidata]
MYLCEYLPRLGQVTIYIHTTDAVNKITGLRFENNTLYLQNSRTHALVFPPSAVLPEDVEIRSIIHDGLQLVVRVSVPAPAPHPDTSAFMTLASHTQRWSVRDLLAKTPALETHVNDFRFVCASCDAPVLSSADYKFGDMPLEFWHELMEFWHCHKPHQPHPEKAGRTYDGTLLPRAGFVYIGASYLLLAAAPTHCPACAAPLGEPDPNSGATKLRKWNLALAYADRRETYAPHLFVYHAVLDKINSAGLRKFAVAPQGSADGLCVWISAVGLSVCLDGARHADALKALYRPGAVAAEDDVLEVPLEVWDSFQQHLAETNARLPEASRQVEMAEGGKKATFRVAYLFSQ